MRVAVTGGAGYVGSAVVPALIAAGYHVTVLDLFLYGEDVFDGVASSPSLRTIKMDIRDEAALTRALEDMDAVIHLACISNDPSFELDPRLGRSMNYDAFFGLLRAIRANPSVERLIYASSSSVYGVKSQPDVDEETPCEPLTDYSRYKLLCEEALRRDGLGRCAWVIVRPATVCGYAPRLRLDLTVNLLTIHALVNKAITVFGGTQLRPNLHINDMVAVYRLLLEAPQSLVHGRTFNVGYQNRSVAELAELVREQVGDPAVRIEVKPTDDPRSYHINADRIKRVLGFAPQWTLENAIRSLCAAYDAGKIPEPLTHPRYYNMRVIQQLIGSGLRVRYGPEPTALSPEPHEVLMQSVLRRQVRFSYLPEQFQHPEEILDGIRQHLKTCQFTLGPEVAAFERTFASFVGVRHAIGVANGTDALMLSLRVLGIGHGDEVITAASTFVATVGAINAVGARPVLVDATPYFTIDPALIERAITPQTRAILPVHLTGDVADMDPILAIAERHGLAVIEDACQAIGATYHGKPAGGIGVLGAFSLHPLKNLNVWGDGGVIVTDDAALDERLRLLRNHGLKHRDEIDVLGYNSRLDSIQAIVGNWLIQRLPEINQRRIAHAAYYDQTLASLAGPITLPPRRAEPRRVFHLYQVYARERDALSRFLLEQGIEVKIHYPIPLPLQRGLAHLGYQPGDFPETERQAASLITLPVDQHLTEEDLAYTVDAMRAFYHRS